jgi:hypothetical protein
VDQVTQQVYENERLIQKEDTPSILQAAYSGSGRKALRKKFQQELDATSEWARQPHGPTELTVDGAVKEMTPPRASSRSATCREASSAEHAQGIAPKPPPTSGHQPYRCVNSSRRALARRRAGRSSAVVTWAIVPRRSANEMSFLTRFSASPGTPESRRCLVKVVDRSCRSAVATRRRRERMEGRAC